MTKIEPTGDAHDVAALGGSISPESAEDVHASVADRRRLLAVQRLELEATVKENRDRIERDRAAMEKKFQSEMQALNEKLDPLRAELAILEEKAWTVDLYLGRHEDVKLIRDGAPAPADTPITIRQTVLAADEESLILGEEASFDHRHMETFVEWLAASGENRDRVIPDQRGVVVVIATRQHRDYGNSFENAQRELDNRRAHWIIRNGERLYVMVTDPELQVGNTTLPKRDEFVKYFYRPASFSDRTPQPLSPGSQEWLDAEKKAGKHQRHYMRLMLVLQGLIDRSVAFHPLPEQGVNLLSITAQDSGAVILVDEESMTITDGRPSFKAWQHALNQQLRPGHRVVLGGGMAGGRIYPEYASAPKTGVPHLVEEKKGASMIVRYERADKIWKETWEPTPGRPGYVSRHYGDHTPKRRASITIAASDDWVLPFDLASVPDLEYYLNSRAARTDYQSMVPVIRSAIKAKREEFEAEAPLRRLLADTIAQQAADVDEAALEAELDEAILWWKVGNKYGRAMAGAPETEASAAPAILKEWKRRRDLRPSSAATDIALAAAKRLTGVMAVAYTRSKKFVAYAPSGEQHGPWLTEYTFNAKGEVSATREWITIASRRLSTQRVVWSDERWARWDFRPDVSLYLTGPEREEIIAAVVQGMRAAGETPIMVTERPFENVDSWSSVRVFVGLSWNPEVDPTDNEAYRSTRDGMDALVSFRPWVWTRSKGGQIEFARSTNHAADAATGWGKYSSAHDAFSPSVPYWSGGNKYRDADTRLRLAWKDDVEHDRAFALHAAHEETAKASHAADDKERHEAGTKVQTWIRGIRRYEMQVLTATAREDFLHDFGAEAAADPALWEHHLSTLHLDKKVQHLGSSIEEMLHRLARASVPAEGKSLRELAQIDATLREDQTPLSDATLGALIDTIVLPAEDES